MSLEAAHPDLPSADKTQKASTHPGGKEGSSGYFQRSQTGIRTKCEARVRRGDSRAPEIPSKSGRGERDGKRHKASHYRPRARLGCGELELDSGCKGGGRRA